VGSYTLLASRVSGARVTCFEPIPETFVGLEKPSGSGRWRSTIELLAIRRRRWFAKPPFRSRGAISKIATAPRWIVLRKENRTNACDRQSLTQEETNRFSMGRFERPSWRGIF
ncbi:MAG: hypothetical protein ACKN9U_08770, partial [Pirellulaceae bacterium]